MLSSTNFTCSILEYLAPYKSSLFRCQITHPGSGFLGRTERVLRDCLLMSIFLEATAPFLLFVNQCCAKNHIFIIIIISRNKERTGIDFCSKVKIIHITIIVITVNLTLETPTLQNGQTHSNNSSTVAEKLFECVWPFCGIGT